MSENSEQPLQTPDPPKKNIFAGLKSRIGIGRPKDSKEDPWRATAEFLNSTPRSKEIRDVCVQIVERAKELVNDPDVVNNPDEQSTLYAEIEALGGRLIEMGIKPDMNTELPKDTYRKSPVKTMEWIAGQLLPETGHRFVSQADVLPIAQEFNVTDMGKQGINATETKDMPGKQRQYMGDATMISGLSSF